MATALDLLSGSARLIGVLGTGEVLSANEASDGLKSLNDLIDTWSTENLLISSKVEESFNLVIGQQAYTIGTGGNFNTTRPQRIEDAVLRQGTANTVYDLPIDIINQDEWVAITLKSTNSTLPRKLYSQNTYPLDTLEVWPVPTVANTLVLWSWKPLTNIASLSTTIDLPKGYARALKYNLALEMAPEYGKMPSDLVVTQAVNSKAAVKRMNTNPIYLGTDSALGPNRRSFNWRTGGT